MKAVPKTKRDENRWLFGKFYSGFFLAVSALPVEPASVHKKLYKKSMQRLYSRKK